MDEFFVAVLLAALAACGDGGSGVMTPEQTAQAKDGTKVTVIGDVFAVTFDSTQTAARRAELAQHPNDPSYIIEDDAEELRGANPAYDDTGAKYPRTPDHYILIRSKVPPEVVQTNPQYSHGALAAAWGLGIHLTDIDAANPMPEIGTKLKVTGTLHKIPWNTREVNGACDTDADCPLGEVCDPSHAMTGSGAYAAHYFPTQDIGRHLCTLAPGSTVASVCPRVYTMRDLIGGRFVTGKEFCFLCSLLSPVAAEDGDTHDQMHVDEPIPYPTDDIFYYQLCAVTENGPPYKDPALPGGPVTDPAENQDVIAVGTYRYDPDHGWYAVHPDTASLPTPRR